MWCVILLLLLKKVVADEERSQVAREVLVTGDGVSGDARERQSVEALPEDRDEGASRARARRLVSNLF